jgi:hypothetical protein
MFPEAPWRERTDYRSDVVRIPRIWLGIVFSLAVHLVAMLEFLPHMGPVSKEDIPLETPGERIQVRLTEPPAAVPTPPPPSVAMRQAPPTPQPRPRAPAPPRVATPPPPAPSPPLAREQPTPSAPVVQAPSAPVAIPPPPKAPEGDLASFIAARRRARGEPEQPASPAANATAATVESDTARRDRIVAANLASLNPTTFGGQPKNSGGIFQITHLGDSDAEFSFFGWNKDIKRRATQTIEVKKGNNPDIRIAVVRRMIAIIREYEQEDFSWESKRLGRVVVLSARAVDTAGLEDFMMLEFFNPGRPTQQ